MAARDAIHTPVLVSETLRLLAPPGVEGWFVDCTVGCGGHAARLLDSAPAARLLGIDRDPEALQEAGERLARYGDRVRLEEALFEDLAAVVGSAGLSKVRGVLADLGLSSLQLERAERGFSFRRDGPLDMRMGAGELTAKDIVNGYSEGQLERIFREFGEEKQARRIARALVEAREREPIRTTGELSRLVARAKRPTGRQRIDPATRVFQALRIEVNRELTGLGRFIDQAIRLLENDGRLVVISYHSLEDRIVKNRFRDLARGEVDEITGRTRSETRLIEVLTKKPIRPQPAEVAANPRSRSARLRAARRI